MNSTRQFVEELLSKVPELRPILANHVTNNAELLPHVFMGDVTRFITNLHSEKLQGSPGSAVSADTLTRALDVLESGMRSDDEEVQELISVSFLENLEQDDPNHLNLKSLLGSSLLEELKKYEW